ncbi:hypothetical protein [Gillisia sp. Hel_I_29]|uniref:hypothetical protein n=1 Tax=Gillisia sp. Hel_I_29 TaxID=1249975 RepID=UPI0005503871|nr:hypothetical protein [Gillisia sp. Hel_I_29]
MKNYKVYLMTIAAFAMLFTSCSKDESSADTPGENLEQVSLTFGAMLQDFNKSVQKQEQSLSDVPECSDAAPAKIRVGIMNSTTMSWVSGGYIDVPVMDNGEGGWMTQESALLTLDAGMYSLEYFAVLDSGDNVIYIAPRMDDNYGPAMFQNFVAAALPISIDLRNGVKKYVDVEVLCYDIRFADEYGYLFFDFDTVRAIYLCVFGNYCDETGRHYPAKFRLDVWNYSGNTEDPKGTPLFNEEDPYVNVTGTYDNDDYYAEPLCVALPDRQNVNDMYYAELYLVESEGNPGSAEPIRMGVFSQEDVETLFYTDEGGVDRTKYYHFREGSCGLQDDSDPCLFSRPTSYLNDFDDTASSQDNNDFLDNSSVETGTNYDYRSTLGWVPGSSPDAAAPLWDEGAYTFTTNPYFVHNHWVNETHDGNMFILNGSTEEGVDAYFVTTFADVCPNSDYYVTFEVRNVYNGASPSNDIVLAASVDGVDLDDPADIITVTYSDGWVKVGLKVKADASGSLVLSLIDGNTEPSGNDFALDNIHISNDPSIMTGLDISVIQD